MNLETRCINTIRFLAVDSIQKANSGHPGMPMGCAPLGHLLFSETMNHNPSNPTWWNRDRFVLSAGHGSMLLYSLLHLCGYNLSMDDLKAFRQWGSKTPGHPEFGHTPGVETTTGPLGQGIANMVGMALAQAWLSARFNRDDFTLFDHFIFGIAGDGCIMEGISHEAASFAGHQKLGQIILFYDDNDITIDGPVSISMSEDVEQRFNSYGWQVLRVEDINDLNTLRSVIEKAKDQTSQPSLIITKSKIGYGSPAKEGSSSAHGSPLGSEEVLATKRNLGWETDSTFFVPTEVSDYYASIKQRGAEKESAWNQLFNAYREAYPKQAEQLTSMMTGNWNTDFFVEMPKFEAGSKLATRAASGKILNHLHAKLPGLIGGSADLTPSNNTRATEADDFTPECRSGSYIRFGIREHAMGAIMNGIAFYGGLVPFGGTFLVFSDYLRPTIRLAGLSKIQAIHVFTHDSIGLGEDGPTHQPVEHAAALRAIPNTLVLRPADANETLFAWKAALNHRKGPSALLLSRQGCPTLDRTHFASAEGTLKGFYILQDCQGQPDMILLASGSEVGLALEVAAKLEADGMATRVVSCPSWELFEEQDRDYQETVLPAKVERRVSIEAGSSMGWARYVGSRGLSIAVDQFGASAPADQLFQAYGFTVDAILKRIVNWNA